MDITCCSLYRFYDFYSSRFCIQKETKMMHLWNDRLSKWTYHFGEWIVSYVSQRMIKAYPIIEETVTIPKKRNFLHQDVDFISYFGYFFYVLF